MSVRPHAVSSVSNDGTFTPGRNTTYDSYATGGVTLNPGNHTLTFSGTVTTGDVTAFVDAITLEDSGVVTYLHSDMLGSASVSTDGTTGALVASMRYLPFGETRFQSGTMATDKRFTGQRAEIGFGVSATNSISPTLYILRFVAFSVCQST